MVNITRIHIHYRLFPKTPQEIEKGEGKMEKISIEPSDNTNVLRMKQDVAFVLKTIEDKAKYYYANLEIEKSDGTPAYRPMIPKTFFKKG